MYVNKKIVVGKGCPVILNTGFRSLLNTPFDHSFSIFVPTRSDKTLLVRKYVQWPWTMWKVQGRLCKILVKTLYMLFYSFGFICLHTCLLNIECVKIWIGKKLEIKRLMLKSSRCCCLFFWSPGWSGTLWDSHHLVEKKTSTDFQNLYVYINLFYHNMSGSGGSGVLACNKKSIVNLLIV